MAFDELLYFYRGLDSGHVGTTSLTTLSLKIDETPVAGLGINVVIPQVWSASITPVLLDHGLQIDIYESDDNATWTLIKTMPGTNSVSRMYAEPGSFWDRFYTDKDYVMCRVVVVSHSAASCTMDFGKVDIRLTDRFAKYAGS